MLVELLILVIVLGLVVYLARQLLPQPFQNIALAVCIVILLVWLLRIARPLPADLMLVGVVLLIFAAAGLLILLIRATRDR